ncbi:hypothetical protein LCGC14_0925800 [marine sediment metagenome]|uniref:IrrE N-terminal-like domain-containing protein n=1 Tax=marine sediment metagenome TaxID=412755 RepID=A0A0F9NPI8_9ZZZZ
MKTVIKIPKQIQIGAHVYNIFYKPHLSKDSGNRGQINHRKQIIFIDSENPTSQQNATIFHEVIHFIDTVLALHLTEDDTDRISEGLLQVLSDGFGIEFDWSDINAEE